MIDVKTLVCCQELFDGDKENLNVVLLFVANKHPTIRMDERGCSLTIVLFFPPKHFWREKKIPDKNVFAFSERMHGNRCFINDNNNSTLS